MTRNLLRFSALGLLALSLAWPSHAWGEGPSPEVQLFLRGNVGMQGSAVAFPLALVQAMKKGKVSPFTQFLLLNLALDRCLENALEKYGTPANMPATVAEKTFEKGVCYLGECAKQIIAFLSFAGMSDNPANGGFASPDDRKSAQDQTRLLVLALAQNNSCKLPGPQVATTLVNQVK